jgi:hypothetical protein
MQRAIQWGISNGEQTLIIDFIYETVKMTEKEKNSSNK